MASKETTNDAAAALLILWESQDKRKTELEKYNKDALLQDSDDDVESECPIYDSFITPGIWEQWLHD